MVGLAPAWGPGGSARREGSGREDKRIVVHHERAKGGDGFDDPVESRLIQAPGKRQDPGAQLPIDGLAELDDKCCIAGIQYPVIRHTNSPPQFLVG